MSISREPDISLSCNWQTPFAGIGGRIMASVIRSRFRQVFALGGGAILSIVGFIGGIYLLTHFEQVDAGEACAVTQFGELTGRADPGVHIRWPFEAYHCFSSRTVVYEASEDPANSDADFVEGWVDTQTADGQEIKVPYRVSFAVPRENVKTIYRDTAQNMDQLVARVVTFHSRPLVRQLARDFTASQLYGGPTFSFDNEGDIVRVEGEIDQLPEFENRVAEALRPVFAEAGVDMISVRISKPEFQTAYVNAIEEKQIAFERIQTERNNAAAAAQEARAEVERAKGRAESVRQEAQAEADAIEARGEALKEYPEVLQLEFVQSLGESTIYLPSDSVELFLPVQEPR